MAQLILDPCNGMAGDMFCAALCDLGVPEKELTEIMAAAARILGEASISMISETRSGMKGMRLSAGYQMHSHSVSAFELEKNISDLCTDRNIKGAYREYALTALSILAEAEKKAHSRIDKRADHSPPHLHEAQDILVDIVGSAWALQFLNINSEVTVCFSPVALGGGTVTFSHGTFPLPAPATREIIDAYDIPVIQGPFPYELLTPTGAALLAALKPRFEERHRSERINTYKKGTGFGSLVFPGEVDHSNALFVYCSTY